MNANSYAEFKTGTSIDRNGLVRGVSVCTIGPAIGHDLYIDATTLSTIQSVAAGFKDGIKCKADHGGGIGTIIGVLRNFRIDGDKVRADLQLAKNHRDFAYFHELIETQASNFGLSMHFSFKAEKIGEKAFARVLDLFSVDLVSQPAANPGGLFSAGGNPSPVRDTTKIAACYLAAFGQAWFSQVVNAHGDNAHDVFERSIYYAGLNIPGYDFSKAARHGERKAPFGLQRLEASRQQAAINACLSKLK